MSLIKSTSTEPVRTAKTQKVEVIYASTKWATIGLVVGTVAAHVNIPFVPFF